MERKEREKDEGRKKTKTSQTHIRALQYSYCPFLMPQYAVPFVGQQKVQFSLLL